jgi:hypothetical protein
MAHSYFDICTRALRSGPYFPGRIVHYLNRSGLIDHSAPLPLAHASTDFGGVLVVIEAVLMGNCALCHVSATDDHPILPCDVRGRGIGEKWTP